MEYDYMLTSADEEGVLIYKIPDSHVFTKVDEDSLTQEDLEKGVLLLSLDKLKELPLDALYWNKKTGNMLTMYQSNARDTVTFPMVLYWLARTDDVVVGMALEKINMQTGEAEWLWKEKNGKGSTLVGCNVNNGYIWSGVMESDGSSGYEMYTLVEKFKDEGEVSDIVKDIFIFMDDVGKEETNYITLASYGMD